MYILLILLETSSLCCILLYMYQQKLKIVGFLYASPTGHIKKTNWKVLSSSLQWLLYLFIYPPIVCSPETNLERYNRFESGYWGVGGGVVAPTANISGEKNFQLDYRGFLIWRSSTLFGGRLVIWSGWSQAGGMGVGTPPTSPPPGKYLAP